MTPKKKDEVPEHLKEEWDKIQLENKFEEFRKDFYDFFKFNPFLWANFFISHRFTKPSPPLHQLIMNLSMTEKFLGVAAPRSSAKSTILVDMNTTHAITFKRKKFIVIVQNTLDKACQTLDDIKSEFNNNAMLRDTFDVKVCKDTRGDSTFVHKDNFKTRVLCKGYLQMGSIRGEKYQGQRPDLIIIDDLEDDEMVRNPDRRRELRETFDDALVPAGDVDKCQYIMVGTILHDDSLMAKIVSKEDYKMFRKIFCVALCENKKSGKEQSLWPEMWDVEALHKMREEKPETFAKEYQNDPVSGIFANFNREDFRYWRVENGKFILLDEENRIINSYDPKDCKGAISCDLAWEEKRESDFSVIMPGYLTPNSEMLVEHYVCKKGMRPDEVSDVLFEMEKRMKAITGYPVPIGMEKAKLEKVVRWYLQKEMRARNYYMWLKDLLWDRDKITRIVTRLSPMYKAHAVFHRKGMGELEHQLIRIPSGIHDDLPDAEQGLAQLLDFTRTVKPKSKEDTKFDKLLKFVRESKKTSKYRFGKKADKFPFPTIKTPFETLSQ